MKLSRVAGDRPPTDRGIKGLVTLNLDFMDFTHLDFFQTNCWCENTHLLQIGVQWNHFPIVSHHWESSPNIFGFKKVNNFAKPLCFYLPPFFLNATGSSPERSAAKETVDFPIIWIFPSFRLRFFRRAWQTQRSLGW